MIQEAEWKIDRSKFLMDLFRILFDYGLLPFVVWTILSQSLGIELIGNTFFAVFLVFGILRIIRLLLDPPGYQKAMKCNKVGCPKNGTHHSSVDMGVGMLADVWGCDEHYEEILRSLGQ